MVPAMKRTLKRPASLLVVLLALFGLVAAACGSDDSSSSSTTSAVATTASSAATTTTTTTPPVTGNITVFAAASLTAAFNDIGAAFAKANPQAKATFSYDASSALVAQIIQGAPADVFASADTANMDKLTTPGLNAAPPVIFATNLLGIIVPKGNPKGITGVADLAKPDLKVVLCADGVPCGTYAKQILASANVTVTPVSLEQNVKGVVTKVTAGEADAGIVYVTDITAAGGAAQAITIPTNINVVAKYPAAVVEATKSLATSTAFVTYLTSTDAQAILAKYGFGKPT
jgi:molybdate transport system substrate-binding protein